MKHFAFSLVALCLSFSVLAKDNASIQSVEKLLEVSDSKFLHDAIMKDFGKMVEQSMQNTVKQMSSEQQQQFKKNLAQIEQLVQEEMSWEKIKPQYIHIYRDTYTQKEVNDLIHFYQTPSGQSFIKKQPQLIEKSSQIVADKMNIILERFEKTLLDEK